MSAAIDNDALAELLVCLALIVVVEDLGERVEPANGHDIELSIDTKVQFFAYQRIRARLLAQHNPAEGPLPAVRPIFWTMWVSIGLAAVGFLIVLVL